MKKVLIIISISLVMGCAAYKPIAPVQSDADRAAKHIKGITLADLNQGKAIFEDKCGKCHSLKKPFNKSEEDVKKAMPKMARRSKIDSEQKDLVLNYLLTMRTI